MRCAACGTENRDDRHFCRECGVALAVTCATCGAANEPGDRFCGACGAAMQASSSAAPARREGAERRMTSILFADIVGFTPLSESRDPEEVRELLGRYFETSREIVRRYGGTIEKFIGDAVVAVWGAPQAQEDDAERAVRTALDLVTAVRELGAEAGVDLALRAGVSTGNVAVTLGADGQGMVAGDVVNTTARIQSVAEPGTVLVDEATRRATEAAIAHQPGGRFELKGKAEPVELSRALRVVAALRGEGRSRGLEPPFVGRERELSMLKQLLHATTEDSRTHMVVLSGIGGIGKSRLAWEFEKYTDGLVDLFLWHRGRCLSYGDGVAFWALAEIMRMRCRIVEDEGEDTASAKLEETLREYVPEDERAVVRGPLRHLLGLSAEPDWDRNRLFPAWRLFIERMADTAPVVLLFEDLQWADGALLEFIEYLMEWSRHQPLFVLALARPELAERRAGWQTAARGLTSLSLEPLTREEMLEVVRGMTPGAPDELVERIADGAEGVPLYAVETVRMLLDRGLLVREGEELVAAHDLRTLEIPETLHALIAARLDALPEAERRLIEDAAVLGKTFTMQGLAAVSGIPENELQPLVASLVRREVLSLQTDPRSPERGQYAFVQAIVRTIAYETIGRRERKRRHLASAQHLEAIGGDELAEVIAAHYVDAYRLAPDDQDADELAETAVRTLVKAAERAESLAAVGEAARLLDAALDLTDDSARRGELLEEIGRLTLANGNPAEAARRFGEALEVFEQLGDPYASARATAMEANARFLDGHTDESLVAMERAYAVLRQGEDNADLAALAQQYGRMLMFQDRVDESEEPLERALIISQRLALHETLVHAFNTKGVVLPNAGRIEEGLALLQRALDVALEHGLHEAAMRSYFNLSYTRSLVDDPRGEEADRRGEELAHRVGDRNWEAAFLMHQAARALVTGDWDRVMTLEEQATAESADIFAKSAYALGAMVRAYRGDADTAAEALRQSGLMDASDIQSRASWAMTQSACHMAAGRWAEAAEVAAAWRDSEPSMGSLHPGVRAAHVNWAESALRAGDPAPAREYVARNLSLPPALRSPYLHAHTLRLRVLVGDSEHAGPDMRRAAEILRQAGLRFDLMRTLADAAEILPQADPWSATARAEALELAGELGAVVITERLEPSETAPAVAGA